MPTVTRQKCAVLIKKMALASTETNVSLLTAIKNYAQFPDTLNTRQTCVAPITVLGSVHMVPDVILSTHWMRCAMLLFSLLIRNKEEVQSSNCQCLVEMEEILGLSMETMTNMK